MNVLFYTAMFLDEHFYMIKLTIRFPTGGEFG